MTDSLFSLKIESLAAGGAGVGRKDGKVVFVMGAYPGDTIMARTVADKKKHIEASLARVTTPSPSRRCPPCPHTADCGGCPWMGLNYDQQIVWKRKIVIELFKRIGGVDIAPEAMVEAKTQNNYRSRVQLKVNARDGVRIGYHRAKSNDIVPIRNCVIANNRINAMLSQLWAFWERDGDPVKTAITEVELDTGSAEGRGRITIHSNAPLPATYVNKMLDSCPDAQGVAVRQGKHLDSHGDTILETSPVEDVNLRFGPGVFSQVNPEQNVKLVEIVAKYSGLTYGISGLDLFCGMGNFTIPLALLGAAMTGVETAGRAVEDAKSNAIRLKAHTAGFVEDMSEKAAAEMVGNGLAFHTVILDPPRGGAAAMIESVTQLAKERIVYVSCYPPALARDTAMLARAGFELRALSLVDMFPQTAHVEAVALFSRDKSGH